MSSNKTAKMKLIERYGKEDFLDRLGVKVFDKPVEYKGKAQKKRMKELSYHHIQKREHGGKATIENGALLRVENHAWFHKQSEEVQRELNKKFQELKKSIDEGREVPVVEVDELDFKYQVRAMEFKVEDRKKFNRTAVKKKTKKLVDEYERGDL